MLGHIRHFRLHRTIQRIFLCLGLELGLNFVLPSSGNHLYLDALTTGRMDRKVPWHRHFLKHQSYDILALHVPWDRNIFGFVYIT